VRLALLLSAAHPADDMRVVRKEGAALAAAGWRVRHLCPGGADAPARVGLTEIEVVPGRRRHARWGELYRRAVALRPAVIHASEPDAWAVALLAGRRCGARVVLDVHEHYSSRLDARLPAAAAAGGAGGAAPRPPRDGADGGRGGAGEGRAGVDYPGARPIAVRNHALVPAGLVPRRHAAGPLTLVHLGAIGRARGWPELLTAMALLPTDTRLLVLGRFTDGSEAAFRAEAARLGLAGRIELAGWLPAEAALARAAAEGDVNLVLFQPGDENHRLALPHKLFDGMAAGLPVVAPRFAEGVASIVEATGCGVLADVSDPAAVAAAVRSLAEPARRQAMGNAGRLAAEGEWGWPAEAERLVALYRELAAGR
jgi:glycosyltransferase involved in cell wall biosynthesis